MKRLVVFLAALALFTLSAANAQTLIFGQSGLPAQLDTGQDGNSLTVSYQVVENLVAYAPGSADIAPGLALSWQPNEDATVWTFKLREGVKFHDDTDFNAEAVKFNFDRWNNQDNEYAYAADGKDLSAWTYVFGNYYGEDGYLLESVEAPDATTVVFTLTRPNGFLPQAMAAAYFGLHSPQAIMEGGPEYGTPAGGLVGTGAFTFVEWIDGERVTLARNENYWGEGAGVEEIVFRGIEEPATRLAELEAGTIDIATNLSPDDYETITTNTELVVPPKVEGDLRLGYIGMHQANEPFDDLRVRQAVAYAIDKEAIIDAFYSGGELGQVAAEFIPAALFGNAGLEAYPYDPEKAKELLAEAGLVDGFDTQFWYMPVSRPYYPNPQDLAEAVATYLADVGINVELMTEDWGVYLENYKQGKYPIYMLGWSADFADPDNFITPFFNPKEAVGALGWDNPEVSGLIEQAQGAPTQEAREELYKQISQIIYDEIPSLPMVNPTALDVTRSNIEGFQPSSLGSTVSFAAITKAE
ncbi:MAG: ABC transporter substrate-binding protein [Trueperaceae bacterium]